MLAGPMSFLLRRPAVLDVANKRLWLSHQAAALRSKFVPSDDDNVDERDIVWVAATTAFSDWAAWQPNHDARMLWRPFWHRLRLVDSPQALGSGVEREWLELCARELSTTGLLAPTADGGRTLAPRPGPLQPADTACFEAFGSLLGYVLVNDRMLPLPLEAPFLRALLGRQSSLSLDDLEAVDPIYCRSLRVVLDTPNADVLGLTWTAEEGGDDTPVTDANKAAFVAAAAAWRLHGRIADAVAAVRRGLLLVVPREWLSVLTDGDLGIFIAGVREIDVADWQRHTQLEGFEKDDPLVGWFWRCVEAMSKEERSLLLRFSTGSGRAPPGGFSQLMGLHGVYRFTLQSRPDVPTNRLPTAATCFNTLALPPYGTFSLLQRKLLAAVRFGAGGFEFV